MKRLLVGIATVAVGAIGVLDRSGRPVAAQNRVDFPFVARDSGHVALGVALRRLNVSGTFMEAPAHPDDEHNALFAMFTYGMGLRSVDVQTNRGDGGQNEIGPELFQDLAVLRTSELLSAHRLDGAEQFFTRAIDYGYSFDPQEVIAKWGREAIVGDFVRLIRTLRPDVLLTMNIQGRGGDRAHEATTILVREAYLAAGNPAMFPGQLQEGLRPWQPNKLYLTPPPGSSPAVKLTRVDTSTYDPLLGRTYAEIGADAHSYHKCQGTNGLPTLPGFGGGRGSAAGAAGFQLVDSKIPGQMNRDEASLFDGIDTSLSALARFAGSTPPDGLNADLATIGDQARRAQAAFDRGNDAATAAPVEAGLAAVRALRAQLTSNTSATSRDTRSAFAAEIKERDYQDAVLAAHGVSFDAVADDGLVVAGQPVKLSLLAVNRGPSEISVSEVDIAGLEGAARCVPAPVKKDTVYTCSLDARIPGNARLTTPYFSDDYWKTPSKPAIDIFEPGVPFGVPFRPTPFRVTFHVKAGDADVTRELPIQYRYVKDIYNGDKRMEINVVPAFSVKVTPSLAVIPAKVSGGSVEREIHVSVTNGTKSATQASVKLEAPAGWSVSPASVPVSFVHEDESLSARFQVIVPAQAKLGT